MDLEFQYTMSEDKFNDLNMSIGQKDRDSPLKNSMPPRQFVHKYGIQLFKGGNMEVVHHTLR